MDDRFFLATYTFYLTVFIDQMLDNDNFGINEQLAVTNVCIHTTAAALIFSQEKLDLKKAKTFITQNLPKDMQKTTYSTLEDMLKLELPQENITPTEISIFSSMGAYLLEKNKHLAQSMDLSKEELEILFSSTMFCFEVLGILAEHDYNIARTREEIVVGEYDKEILLIINDLEKLSSTIIS